MFQKDLTYIWVPFVMGRMFIPRAHRTIGTCFSILNRDVRDWLLEVVERRSPETKTVDLQYYHDEYAVSPYEPFNGVAFGFKYQADVILFKLTWCGNI